MKKGIIKQFIIALSFVFTLITIVSISVSVKATDNTENDQVEHIIDGDLYYSDAYFKHSSTEYDPHLATLSMYFARSSAPSGDPKTKLSNDEWFKTQPNNLKSFLTKIHFTDFSVNEDYEKKTAFDTIGVACAQKKISDEYTVVALGIRSGHYELEWSNNIWLGDGSKSDYMHEGWYNAANKAINFLNGYVKNNIDTPKIKLWVAGFSRGGATANLTAGLLDNQIKNSPKKFENNVTLAHDDLFAYTYEAPQGANYNSKTVEQPKSKIYNNIWNIINPNDLVPKVAMSQYGFTRFGTDKYITTKFYDPAGFETNRIIFNSLLKKLTSSDKNPDEFEMYGLPIDFLVKGLASKISNGDFTVLQKDNTKSNYDANIAEMLVLEETVKQIGSRENYAKNIQPGLKDLLLVIMEYRYNFDTETGGNIKSRIPAALGGFIAGGIIYLMTGSVDYIKTAMALFNPYIDSETISAAVTAAIPLFNSLFSVYWNKPNELISLGKYMEQEFHNHDTEVTIAHIQAQDSYYIDAYNADPKNKNTIRLVPFLDNADYGRISFLGFNDLGLYCADTRRINIEGYVLGKSDIKECEAGYAAGYYSYATEERMEVFFPAKANYKVNVKDYSKKPYHTFDYWAYYQYFGLGPNGETKRQLAHFHDWTCFNSKRYSFEISVN